jgi:hypothetical protein
VGPVGFNHNEGIIWLFTFQAMKLFVFVGLNLLLVEFSRLYERTKDFGASLNSLFQFPLAWILVVNAMIGVWWRHSTRNLTYLEIFRLKVAAVST